MIDDGAKFLDQLPDGWLVLRVMPLEEDGREWWALVTDVNPDTDNLSWWLRNRSNDETFIRIPGEHETYEAACDAFEVMTATRH